MQFTVDSSTHATYNRNRIHMYVLVQQKNQTLNVFAISLQGNLIRVSRFSNEFLLLDPVFMSAARPKN